MKFQRYHRVEFTDTPRKRAAFFAKQRREREAQPLFAEQIAEEQASRPGIDEVMRQRAIGFAESEQKWRNHRASKWREARAKIAAHDEPTRKAIRALWKDAPYPADPVYLLGMLHDIEKGRMAGSRKVLSCRRLCRKWRYFNRLSMGLRFARIIGLAIFSLPMTVGPTVALATHRGENPQRHRN